MAARSIEVFQLTSLVTGDFNFDGHFDAADIAPMEQALTDGSTFATANNLSAANLTGIGDLNGDGVFNNADLQKMMLELTAGNGSSQSVPEPTSAAWLELVLWRCPPAGCEKLICSASDRLHELSLRSWLALHRIVAGDGFGLRLLLWG